MDKSHLIVLEGIDCSGKTSLAKQLATHLGWRHEHEPRFSSIRADKLNFDGYDGWQREYFFMKDRMEHQSILNKHDIVMDRYIWTGLAYANVFSPNVLPMMKSIYSLSGEFKIPNLTFFIDMPPEEAYKLNMSKGADANEKLTIEKLKTLRSSYYSCLEILLESPEDHDICIIKPIVGNMPDTFDKILRRVNAYFN